MSLYLVHITLGRDYQGATIERDQGREHVTVEAGELGAFLSDLAADTTQVCLRRWFVRRQHARARPVVSYDGATIEDAGSVIMVRFTAPPMPGVIDALRQAGFRDAELTDVFERRSNPQAILAAQAVLGFFYGDAA